MQFAKLVLNLPASSWSNSTPPRLKGLRIKPSIHAVRCLRFLKRRRSRTLMKRPTNELRPELNGPRKNSIGCGEVTSLKESENGDARSVVHRLQVSSEN